MSIQKINHQFKTIKMNRFKIKNQIKIFHILSLAFIMLLAGCKDSEPEIKVEKVTIKGYGPNSRSGYDLRIRSIQLEAIIEPENASNQSVTWTSSDDRIASVNNDGMVYFESVGNVTIYANCRGVQGVANLMIFTQDLAAPENFTITNIGTSEKPELRISWDYMAGINYYEVYKTYQVESGGFTTKKIETEDTFIVDSDISLGKTYKYNARAFINEFEFSKYTKTIEINL